MVRVAMNIFKISIIIPFYNSAAYLENCVKSLCDQSYSNLELIFVNDGSTDHSKDIILKHQKNDDRVFLIEIENSGPGIARNHALLKASGEYVMFCDSDDSYSPYMVAEMVSLIAVNENVDIAMCNTKINLNGVQTRSKNSYFFNEKTGIHELTQTEKASINIVVWNKIFKNKIIKDYNLSFLNQRYHEDENFIYKYLSVSKKINYTNKKLYTYNYREDSISEETLDTSKHMSDYLTCFEDYYNFIKEYDLLNSNLSYFAKALIFATHMMDSIEDTNFSKNEYAKKIYDLSQYIKLDALIINNQYEQVANIKNGKIGRFNYNPLQQYIGQKNIIPIFFSCDQNYAPYLSVAIASIIANATSNKKYIINILDCGILVETQEILKKQIYQHDNFTLHIIPILSFIERHKKYFHEKDHFSTAIYGRLIIPGLCKGLEKALYLDTDMIFGRDVAEIFDFNIGSNYIAAVIDPCVEMDRIADNWWTRYFVERIGIVDHQAYINSGLILFNIKIWNELELALECIKTLQDNKMFIFPDQDAINMVCKNNIFYLNQKYNCTMPTNNAIQICRNLEAIRKNISLERLIIEYKKAYSGNNNIFHYTSSLKPWSDKDTVRSYVWWKYARNNPYYERILSSLTAKNTPTRNVKKRIKFLGLPLCKIITTQSYKKIYFLGVRFIRVAYLKDKSNISFLGLKLFKTKSIDIA